MAATLDISNFCQIYYYIKLFSGYVWDYSFNSYWVFLKVYPSFLLSSRTTKAFWIWLLSQTVSTDSRTSENELVHFHALTSTLHAIMSVHSVSRQLLNAHSLRVVQLRQVFCFLLKRRVKFILVFMLPSFHKTFLPSNSPGRMVWTFWREISNMHMLVKLISWTLWN